MWLSRITVPSKAELSPSKSIEVKMALYIHGGCVSQSHEDKIKDMDFSASMSVKSPHPDKPSKKFILTSPHARRTEECEQKGS